MAQILDMPQLSDTMKIGVLQKWRKNEGDAVTPGEVIAEVESSPRSAYAGAFGWIAADGRADLGVVIRSLMTGGDGCWTLGTGGGITVQSTAAEEYAESAWKADRLRAVFDEG